MANEGVRVGSTGVGRVGGSGMRRCFHCNAGAGDLTAGVWVCWQDGGRGGHSWGFSDAGLNCCCCCLNMAGGLGGQS